MIPHKCTVSHKPQYGFYGDCVRACVASILEQEPETVPHFYQDNCDAVEGEQRLTRYLKTQGLGDFRVYYPGEVALDEILDALASATSDGVHYMLYCSLGGESNHVIVGCGAKIVHDPAWYVTRNYQATNAGYWVVSVFVKL